MSLRHASVFRACQPCRSAKVKCDLSRPVCGRCARRHTNCFGYSDEVIRDQTATVEARAERQARRQNRTAPSQPAGDLAVSVTLSSTPNQEDLPSATPWLKSDAIVQAPRHATGDIDTRAVEYFFKNWILWPCNHHVSPGHLQDLPYLYEQSPPGTAIRLAIEALAYADIPNYGSRALSKYGHALSHVREVIGDPDNCKRDAVLAALLVVDNFELMHSNRQEPLGPHSAGLIHLLKARGDDQLLNRRGFALWRVAHHRLQARQLLLKEHPQPEQEQWVHSLNSEQPDLHITVHVYNISKQSARARVLLTQTDMPVQEVAQQVRSFFDEVHNITTGCFDWIDNRAETWRPRILPFSPSEHLASLLENVSVHHDIWLAYMMNFHIASSIIMRESVIDVLTSPLAEHAPFGSIIAREHIDTAIHRIHEWSTALLQTMPQLLGMVDYEGRPRISDRDLVGQKIGKGLGAFFAFYTLWVIRACTHTPDEHKLIADKLLDWIHQQNSRL